MSVVGAQLGLGTLSCSPEIGQVFKVGSTERKDGPR